MRDQPPGRYIHNILAARTLRKPQTPTEQALWDRLRNRRFLGLKFRRQHAVHRFVLDFYCHELRLAIEVDGGIHDNPQQRLRDAERQSLLEAQGIHIYRIHAHDITHNLDAVLTTLSTHITNLQTKPLARDEGVGRGGRG